VLHAIEASTGKTVWTHGRESDERERSSRQTQRRAPAVANGTVYWPSAEGLYALDAQTAQVRWRIDSPTIMSPTVANGTVYFVGNALHAIDAQTGRERWRFGETAEQAGSFISAGPIVDNGLVFIGRALRTGGELLAIDAATGQERWRVRDNHDTSKERTGSVVGIAVHAGAVYFSFIEDDASFRSVDARTGQEKWRRSRLHLFLANSPEPVIAGGMAYIIAMEASRGFEGPASLYALDARTGEEAWRRELDLTFDDRFRTEVIFADGLLYTGVARGLVAMDAKRGEERWRFKTDEHVYPGPTVSNGVLYFGVYAGVQGVLHAMR